MIDGKAKVKMMIRNLLKAWNLMSTNVMTV